MDNDMAVNCEIFFHGVLSTGQEFWSGENSFSTDYYKKFYTPNFPKKVFCFEISRNQNNQLSSYYSLRFGDVSANLGGGVIRSGSYFGITIQIDGFVSLELRTIYSVLQNCFDLMIIGKILVKNGQGFKYIPRSFKEIEGTLVPIYQNLLEKLGALSFSHINSNQPSALKLELSERDLFVNTEAELVGSGKSIWISPEYQSVFEKKLANEITQVKLDAQKNIQQKESENIKKLSELKASLNSKINDLEQKCKGLLKDVDKAKEDAKLSKEQQNQASMALESEIFKLNKAIDSLEHGGLDKLIRFRNRYNGESDSDKQKDPTIGPVPPKGSETNIKRIIWAILLGLVSITIIFFISRWFSSNDSTPNEPITDQTEHFGDDSNTKPQIDIIGLNNGNELIKGNKYKLRLKGGDKQVDKFEIIFSNPADTIRPDSKNDFEFSISHEKRTAPNAEVDIKCIDSDGNIIAEYKHIKIKI